MVKIKIVYLILYLNPKSVFQKLKEKVEKSKIQLFTAQIKPNENEKFGTNNSVIFVLRSIELRKKVEQMQKMVLENK
jgi:hypothetical protein